MEILNRTTFNSCHFLIVVIFLSLVNITASAQVETPVQGSTITIAANKKYEAGLLRRIFLGAHYRKEWATPVVVDVYKIDTAKGGLKPIKMGGSNQTTNLRLEDSLGHQYVIRSVNKTPTNALPLEFRKTVIAKIFQDQSSAENPYGSLTVPTLARSAGVFYTSPQLIYIPYDTSLGSFAPVFGGTLAYIEERPDGDMSAYPGSGHSKHVIGTEKMFEKIFKKNDNKVDDELFLRTRLFDMLLGDWGRHEDQWRWAEFEQEDGGTLFKPIPRDRDHVFFKSDGILPFLGSRKFAFRKTQNFGYTYKDIIGLNLSATSIDRALLNALTKDDWLRIAESLKASISDSAINEAVRKMPENIYPIHGAEIESKLRNRRERLAVAASKYYKALARVVDVVGTEEAETFVVSRLDKKRTMVTVLNTSGDTLYNRVFYKNETHEIRLYGIAGKDEFKTIGDKKSRHLRIRIVEDGGFINILDSVSYTSLYNQYLYTAGSLGNQLMNNTKIIFMRSDIGPKNEKVYDRFDYAYNLTAIKPSIQYNPDDGIFLGLGIVRKAFGFRKYPYASFQTGGFNFATGTGSVSFNYFGDFKKLVGDWNFSLDILTFGPQYASNYFGLGNETEQVVDNIDYYRVRASHVRINPLFYKNFTRRLLIGVGPLYQYVKIQDTPDRFISTPAADVSASEFGSNSFLGVKFFGQINTLDNIILPKTGVRFNLQTSFYRGVGQSNQFVNISPDFSFFITPKFAKNVTFASRTGMGTNIGDYLFYQSNTLGGTTNLRGYRRTRFYGKTMAYQNTEARIKLVDLNFYLFPGKVGLILFYDIGRVWQPGEHSHLWHMGFGPGAYVQVYNRMAVSAYYGIGKDKSFLNIQVGFFF